MLKPLDSEAPLIIYLDFKSPYAYLAIDPTRRLLSELGLIADWRPFVLDIPSYLVAHPSKLEAAVNWKNFGTDPAWQEVYRESIADGRLVKDIQRVFMTETPYSP